MKGGQGPQPAVRSRLRLRLALLVVSTLVAVVASEVACQLLVEPVDLTPPPPERIDPYGPNPYILNARPFLYFHRPHARYTQSHRDYQVEYRINSLGFRGPEPPPRPADRRRLLVIGDSVVEGHGVELGQAFPALLDRRLAPNGWEVINAGVQGASPIYFAANLSRYLSLDPDAILVVLFGNDLREDRFRERDFPRLRSLESPQRLLAGGERGPLERSRLVSLTRARLGRILGLYDSAALRRLAARNLEASRESGSPPELLAAATAQLEDPELLAREWKMSAGYLDLLVEGLAAREVEALFVFLPMLRRGDAPQEILFRYSEKVGERAEAWASERSVPLLSAVVPVRRHLEALEAEPLTFAHDGHPSPRGHSFLAELLGPWLRARLPE